MSRAWHTIENVEHVKNEKKKFCVKTALRFNVKHKSYYDMGFSL